MAGVSSATASQILNGRENWASSETRERVISTADKLGYRPSLVAKSLRVGQTYTLGLVMTVLSGTGRAYGFDMSAADAGYMAVMAFNPNDPGIEDMLIQRLLDRGVDGIAIYPSERGPHRQLRRLASQGFPLVTFDGAALGDLDCDDVSPDYEAVGRLQASHALFVGKRRVLIVAPQPAAAINKLRDRGIGAELARQGAPPPLVCEFSRPGDVEMPESDSIYGPLHAFIERNIGEFDAVISYDSVASLACRSLTECGLSIPDDVEVIGAGDGAMASYAIIPLTSVATNDQRIGEMAFEMLRERIEAPGKVREPRRVRTGAVLHARQSTVGDG